MINFYSSVQNLLSILLGIVGIGFLIGFHELGHFAFCKLFKVKTPSFSIGFGPQLFKKQIGETEFSLSAIPFGGYVEIAGIQEVGQGEQASYKDQSNQSFAKKPYWQKLLILSGGIIFNILISYLIMILLFSLGAPTSPLINPKAIPPKIGTIIKDLAAHQAGLLEGDLIKSVNLQPVSSSLELNQIIQASPKTIVQLEIVRNHETINIPVTVGSAQLGDKEIGQLGIQFSQTYNQPLSLVASVKTGIKTTNQMLSNMTSQFKSMFQHRQYQAVGGPIMIISEVANSAKHGLRIFLLLLVVISLNLAVLNLIPLPILDGGQILFTTIEALIGRSIPEKIRLGIHYACWFSAILLAIYLSYQDILKLIKRF